MVKTNNFVLFGVFWHFFWSGQRVTCSGSSVCGACPPNLPLPAGAVATPSNTSSCMMLCGAAIRPVGAATCTPTSQVCPTGAYPIPGGGGTCAMCPGADLACPAGQYLSGCLLGLTPPVCSACAASLLLESGATQPTGSRQWLRASDLKGSQPFSRPPSVGTCITACANDFTFDGAKCITCPVGQNSRWNASKDARWWPPSQDAHYGMPPTTSTMDIRAGVCWPCQPFVISSGRDLCDTPITHSSSIPFQSTLSMTSSQVVTYPFQVVLKYDGSLPKQQTSRRHIMGVVGDAAECHELPDVYISTHGCVKCPPSERCGSGRRRIDMRRVVKDFVHASSLPRRCAAATDYFCLKTRNCRRCPRNQVALTLLTLGGASGDTFLTLCDATGGAR